MIGVLMAEYIPRNGKKSKGGEVITYYKDGKEKSKKEIKYSKR